jgi:hypothetical protein
MCSSVVCILVNVWLCVGGGVWWWNVWKLVLWGKDVNSKWGFPEDEFGFFDVTVRGIERALLLLWIYLIILICVWRIAKIVLDGQFYLCVKIFQKIVTSEIMPDVASNFVCKYSVKD